MYHNKKFLALIPARGGSKGIPNKNITEVKGRPLIDYTIKEALASDYIDSVIVSTDSKEIAKISTNCGAEVPFLRPSELATDESKVVDTVNYTIRELKKMKQTFDFVVLLQPTQPLRQRFHIDEAIKLIVDKEIESLVSVSEVRDHPILYRTINPEGSLVNLIDQNSTVRRQDFKTFYKVNGAIHINKINNNLNLDTSFNDNKFPYIMDKKYDLDIDEPFDLEILNIMVENIK
ncbi:cytidylyltransferase domain-containing protein [Gracilibacillus xinjiangensis]|uniref:Cytidylyltransferase domain-containing protein n=1 Tax=Gracilibacillus xinjiangensis TaxID=1193282 RepID=A0ABV8WZS5_9BACI